MQRNRTASLLFRSGAIRAAVCGLALLLGGRQTFAQTPAAPAKPNPRDARITATVRYGGTDAHPLTLDFYQPNGPGPHPAVIILHGGGWVGGTSRNGSEAYAADFLAPAGYAVFSINYRLAPSTFADMIADVERSIRFVRHNAAAYAVDPQKIVLLGGSAGGYLSNMVGLLPPTALSTGDAVDRESDNIAAVVTLYGHCCLNEIPVPDAPSPGAPRLFDQLLGAPATPAALLAASPIAHIRRDAPPFLLIHGEQDEAVPFVQSLELANALASAGVRVELIPIPNGRHGTYQWTMPNIPHWERELTEWLNDTLQHSGPVGDGIVRR
ncbi:alpha/beta hydrolase [Terriglobus aquaticus]|uniref:Alpha/beta hydrolase fold domain-containing protein n=1 Tax=Terriglobus aquaticus TaxID=940139 RepID=A0ABW9KNQ5_9BACT|nr:alpha/beta hydrolase [Terriglobus aquaticus]